MTVGFFGGAEGLHYVFVIVLRCAALRCVLCTLCFLVAADSASQFPIPSLDAEQPLCLPPTRLALPIRPAYKLLMKI